MTVPQESRAASMAREGRLAIVHDWLTVPGGAEETLRHVRGFLPAPIHVAQYNPDRFPWLQGTDVRAHWISKAPMSKTRHYLYAPVLADAYRSMKLAQYEAVVTMNHTFAHHARPRDGAVSFAYYYTPARSIWSPEIDRRAGTGFLRNAIVRRIKRLDLEASKRPDYVVAISNTTADRIERFYGREVDAVIYPPVETEKWQDVRQGSGAAGYLVWGRLIPYKKFDLAIDAALLGGFPLQVVGAGPAEADLKERAQGSKRITFHGRLSDADLQALMSECRGVLFPGYEDFGIVPVEAMAAGLPVAAFGVGGAAETVGDAGGELFAQQTPAHLADAVARLDAREFDPAMLRARAAPYSAQRFAQEFADHLERALDRGRR